LTTDDKLFVNARDILANVLGSYLKKGWEVAVTNDGQSMVIVVCDPNGQPHKLYADNVFADALDAPADGCISSQSGRIVRLRATPKIPPIAFLYLNNTSSQNVRPVYVPDQDASTKFLVAAFDLNGKIINVEPNDVVMQDLGEKKAELDLEILWANDNIVYFETPNIFLSLVIKS
jgi:hypothetical protein